MICKFNVMDCTQKELYFKISNAISLENKEATISGIYAIYKNNVCLYVGQSKNLASRISTHLSGKYKEADFVYIINIKDIGFNDFKQRCEISRKSILDNCEKYFIKILKPIENIIADFSIKLDDDMNPLFDEYLPYSYILDCREFKHTGELTIQNEDGYAVFYFDWLSIQFHFKSSKKELLANFIDKFPSVVEVEND